MKIGENTLVFIKDLNKYVYWIGLFQSLREVGEFSDVLHMKAMSDR